MLWCLQHLCGYIPGTSCAKSQSSQPGWLVLLLLHRLLTAVVSAQQQVVVLMVVVLRDVRALVLPGRQQQQQRGCLHVVQRGCWLPKAVKMRMQHGRRCSNSSSSRSSRGVQLAHQYQHLLHGLEPMVAAAAGQQQQVAAVVAAPPGRGCGGWTH